MKKETTDKIAARILKLKRLIENVGGHCLISVGIPIPDAEDPRTAIIFAVSGESAQIASTVEDAMQDTPELYNLCSHAFKKPKPRTRKIV
jgi:hypothetical protein